MRSLSCARALLHTSACSRATAKVPIALISKVRNLRPGTPLALARTALEQSAPSHDVDKALEWIEAQAAQSGAAKAQKLASRAANEGLVGVSVLDAGGVQSAQAAGARTSTTGGARAALVELSCETDFVARTQEFKDCAADIARAAAFFADSVTVAPTEEQAFVPVDVEALTSAPLVPATDNAASTSTSEQKTVGDSIAALVARLGEKIVLRRAATVAIDPPSSSSTSSALHVLGAYAHGGSGGEPGATFLSGTLAALLVLRVPGRRLPADAPAVVRALARQAVALPTSSVRRQREVQNEAEGGAPSEALYEQALMTLSPKAGDDAFTFQPGQSTVAEVLEAWSQARKLEGTAAVVDVLRWEVGR